MNRWHVAVIAIGASLAAFGLWVGKAAEVMPLATLIVGGAMGNAATFGQKGPHVEIANKQG